MLGLFGTLVLHGVALDKWGVHGVEGRVLFVLVSAANVDLHESSLVVEGVGSRPLEGSDDSDTV